MSFRSLNSHEGSVKSDRQPLSGILANSKDSTANTEGQLVFDVGGLLSDELGSVLHSRSSTACSSSLTATSPENILLPPPQVVVEAHPELAVLQAAGVRAHEQTEALLSFWEDVTARHRHDVNSIHQQRLEARRLIHVGHHNRQNKIPTTASTSASNTRDSEHLLTAQYEYLVEGNTRFHGNQSSQKQQTQPSFEVSLPHPSPLRHHDQQHDKSHGSYNLLINDLFSGIHAIRQENEKLKAVVVSGGTYLKGDLPVAGGGANMDDSDTRRKTSPTTTNTNTKSKTATGTCIGRTAALETATTTIIKLRQYLHDVGKEEQLLDAALSEVEILTLVLQGQADSIRAVNTAALCPSMKRLEVARKTNEQQELLSVTSSSSSDPHISTHVKCIEDTDTHQSISETTHLLLAELIESDHKITSTSAATTPSRQLGSFLPVLSANQHPPHITSPSESPRRSFSTNLSNGIETTSIQQLDFAKMKWELRLSGGKTPSVAPNVKLQPLTTTASEYTPPLRRDAAKKKDVSSPTFTDQFVKTLTTVPNGDDVRAFLRLQQHLRNTAGSTAGL